ncbi:MAG: hypothetical protein JXR25_17625, partial [Pontiellaceae bacterium]|nr:hypothetical protein [Pontiellaceae bacterium]
MSDFTLVLNAASNGDRRASDDLLPLIYDELRKLAQYHMSREFRGGHTLQATALVHEAWLRLVEEGDRTWDNRTSFYAAASSSMRRILVEHARRKSRLKHGGNLQRVDIEEIELADGEQEETIL